ncbi:MAG TPA: CHAT domain-containing protein, partial [Adhaeribacter sp.]|nr:CHAT domain-containing protein [Adhaeribacter sp.]
PDKAANLLELAKKQKMRLATDSAYLSYSQAAALFKGKDPAQYTRARLELVSVLLEMKAYNNARHNLKQDLVFIKRNFKPVSNEMWQYYLLLGELQFQQKEIENTFGSWHRARNIAEQLHGTESMQAATAYYYLGKHLLFGGNTDSSWHYANKAIANLNRHPQPWKIEKASAIYNLVGSHFRISHYGQMHSPIKTVVYNGKKYPNAAAVYLAFLDSALIAETYNAGPNGGNSGKVYYNMATAYGDIFQQTNPANQAERKELARKMNFYLDKAEPLLLKNKDPEIAMLYNFRGGQYAVSDFYDFEKASYYYLKALKVCLPEHKGRSLYEMPVISNVQSENNLGLTLDYISYLLMDRYEGEQDLKDLEAVYQYAIKKIELAEYSQDQKQVAYNGQTGPSLIYNNQPYGQAIEMAHKLYEKTGNRKYLEEAFEIAEKFKNFNLVQASLKTRIAQYLKGHKKLADEYNLLKRKLKTLEERQVMARRYPLLRRHVPFTSAGSELARTQTRMKEFEDLVKGDFPQFYQEKIKRNYALTLNEARQQLPDDKTAVLSYFVNEDFMDFSKQAFVFVIQKNSAHFIKMPLPQDYEDHIKSMVLGITTSDLPLYRGHASQLYNLLVKPVQPKLEKQVNNLVVMPDGYLWQIPFETLLNQATASLDYRKLPYLFRNY